MPGLPLPGHYDPARVGEVWRVPYERRAQEAAAWARVHELRPAADDSPRVCLVCVDVQNTFCQPGHELFVAGRSGTGAVDDNRRLCEFLYRNLDVVTQVVATLDTHTAMQVFHAAWLVDAHGEHPAAYTPVSAEDVAAGRWLPAPGVARALGLDPDEARDHLLHYTRRLEDGGKFQLTVWPYHAMLGGIGHALVPAVEEALFFHGLARESQPDLRIKGREPLTEHYSMLGPEVTEDHRGRPIGGRDETLVSRLAGFDAVLVAGQAKSHCVAWTVADLLAGAGAELAGKVYLLEDCSSPVVVPGVVDWTDEADAAYARFADQGAHVVRSTDPIESWLAPAARV